MFAIIGNSPSSGSTFLSDLIDGTPYSTCGPELNFFTNKNLYEDFDLFRTNPFEFSLSSSLYTNFNSLNREDLYHFAMNESKLMEMVNKAKDVNDFFNTFGKRYTTFRGKENAVWFEKTPQNISIVRQYLKSFPNNYFIHIVRNPIFVIPSLVKRGFNIWVAIFTWLFDVAHIIGESNNRIIQVRYEDLVKNPWKETSSLIGTVTGNSVSEGNIEEFYYRNLYRKETEIKIKTWGVTQYGIVKNANDKVIPTELLKKIKISMKYRISNSWAKAYGVPGLSFQEAIDHYGYTSEIESVLNGIQTVRQEPMFKPREKLFLVKKYIRAKLMKGVHAPLVLQPVEPV